MPGLVPGFLLRTMAQITLTLTGYDGSSITLDGVELPESVAWGGVQRVAVHEYVGGGRQIQALGGQPAPLSWSGILFGQEATARARYLDGQRDAGTPVIVSWDDFNYTAVITQFQPRYLQPWHVRYAITIEVDTDNAAKQATAPKETLLSLINNDAATASCLGNLIGDSVLTGLLGDVSSAVQSLNSVVDSVTAPIAAAANCLQQATATAQTALAALVQPISLAQTRVTSLLGAVDNAATSMQTLTSAAFNGATPQAIQSLLGANTGMYNALPLQGLSATLARMQSNIAFGSPGASAKLIAVNGGNLQTIAAAQYKDATLWPAIAKVNGLSDPMLAPGTGTLEIPSMAVAQGGLG